MELNVSFVYCCFSVLLVSCAMSPSYQYFQGDERVDQPGVSFVLPVGQRWAAMMRSTYQSAFRALGMPKDDTVIVSSTVYNLQPTISKEDFLKFVHKGRASEPSTGRFEVSRNTEQLFEARQETCVIYKSVSKDYGLEAKRNGQYSVLETIGMHCIHPHKRNIGVQVEFSHKAPPETTYAAFESTGLAVLKSVTFGAF